MDRVATVDEVVAREPNLIIGSWCDKKFRPKRVVARPCFDRTPAVPAPGCIRDQIAPDLIARTGGTNRWSCRAPEDCLAVGNDEVNRGDGGKANVERIGQRCC